MIGNFEKKFAREAVDNQIELLKYFLPAIKNANDRLYFYMLTNNTIFYMYLADTITKEESNIAIEKCKTIYNDYLKSIKEGNK